MFLFVTGNLSACGKLREEKGQSEREVQQDSTFHFRIKHASVLICLCAYACYLICQKLDAKRV